MRKKKLAPFLLRTCIAFLTLSGCSGTGYGLSSGTYKMTDENECGFAPAISFDLNSDTFTFASNILSSYLNTGTIGVENGNVVGTTDDGLSTYAFQIVDNDTIQFVAGQSHVESGCAMADGAEFKYVEGSYNDCSPRTPAFLENVSFSLPDGIELERYREDVGSGGGSLPPFIPTFPRRSGGGR